MKKKHDKVNRKRKINYTIDSDEMNTEIITIDRRNNIKKHIERFRKILVSKDINVSLVDSLKEVENILIAMFGKNGYWHNESM